MVFYRKKRSSQSDLTNLIKRRKWEKFMIELPMNTNASAREFSKGQPNYMLHEASRVKPPLQVISDLIYYDRNVLGEVDKNGQTPLHIATANNASFKVIEYLTNEFPGAAGMCDHCGKVPLILLCENYCDKQDCDLVDSEDEFIELSGILISASSRSITVEDETGCTALEYAIMNNVGILAVKFLQLQAKKEREILQNCNKFKSIDTKKFILSYLY